MNQDHPDIEKLPLEIDGIPVRETIRQFFRNPVYGTPDDISKAGCRMLALLSNEVGNPSAKYVVWNAWRAYFPPRMELRKDPDYDPIRWLNKSDFSEDKLDARFDFTGFSFGNGAEFSKTIFIEAKFSSVICGDQCKFTNTYWGTEANLWLSEFGDNCDFTASEWGDGARLMGVRWGERAKFINVEWGDNANFRDAQWAHNSDFRASRWGKWSNFSGARWGGLSAFNGAQWGAGATFIHTKWCGKSEFIGSQWAENADFRGAVWVDRADFSGISLDGLKDIYSSLSSLEKAKQWSEVNCVFPNTFCAIDFSGASFEHVKFTNRKFSGKTLFTKLGDLTIDFHSDIRGKNRYNSLDKLMAARQGNWLTSCVRFSHAPEFHGCEFHQDTSFDGAEFPDPTGNEQAARAYRTLKLAFSKQQAVREEQRFFRLEVAEETMGYRNKAKQALREFKLLTGLREGFTWVLYKAYSMLSDYGFSVARPLVLLVAAWLVFAAIYGSHTNGQTICMVWMAGCELQINWLNFSLQQALPLPGFDKLDHPIKGVTVGWLFLHKTISLAALFLIGLALRNLFKLK